MSKTARFLAIDFGAESGRGVIGAFDGEKLFLEEIHRFPNGPVRVGDSLHWDVLRLYREMVNAIGIYAAKYGSDLEGIGVDTWGVDFGLLGKGDSLIGNPYHYRDSRVDGMMEKAFRKISKKAIFENSGIQFIKLNTIYQLFSMVVDKSPLLDIAETLLLMPDLFNFLLTGRKVSEFSIATTTQFYDPIKRAWSKTIFKKLGLPLDIMTKQIVQPGSVIGPLRPWIAEEAGLKKVSVITPGGHDTACAVGAVPMETSKCAYISSGTWSLMGAEIKKAIITPQALEYNFTNEGGVGRTYRFLKNIMGLWLVQECRRVWAGKGKPLPYSKIAAMAKKAKPFGPIIEPDYEAFMGIGDMPKMISAFCRKTGQKPPKDKGAMIRCALESLAMKYRWTLEKLEEIQGHKCEVVHIVGGGTQNKLLCQLTADCTGLPVVAGPIEATAIGNVMMQAVARRHVANIAEAREVIRNSFPVITYKPKKTTAWDDAYEKYLGIVEKAKAL
ncbi:MAG: rhamnulokinase [Planctomycetes bacterium]|nr:rhamnulokinase [Planctomycetota bacterium]